jgi:hypothetical protein
VVFLRGAQLVLRSGVLTAFYLNEVDVCVVVLMVSSLTVLHVYTSTT